MSLLEKIHKDVEVAEKLNEKYDCFITLSGEHAIAKAKELDAKSGQSKARGKLHGIVISVKDNICTKGIRTTAGSAILSGYVPPFNATAIEKIAQEGGIVIGKTAMDSFGFGTFSVNVGQGMPVPKNPNDVQRSAGGSSGGSGSFTRAAMDAGMHHIGLAESTGGSITAPAAFCGVVGFTPTYGRVSRYGLIDYANSLDKIGATARSVEEAKLLASVISGKDKRDETSVEVSWEAEKKVKKIGIPKEMLAEVDKEIEKAFWQQAKKLESHGITCEEFSFPEIDYSVASYYIIATAEASSNLARYTGLRYGAQEEIKGSFSEHFAKIRSKYFSAEEKRRIILGTFVRTAGYRDRYYQKALKIRTKIKQDFAGYFKKYHAIITPAMPIIAPKFEEIAKLTPIETYALDSCTIPSNLAGLPHISIPIGKVHGMPIGMQAICDKFQEETLFSFGKEIETITGKV